MKSVNVEVCMGHDIGISKSYHKPSEKEVLGEYLNAIGLDINNIGYCIILHTKDTSSVPMSIEV